MNRTQIKPLFKKVGYVFALIIGLLLLYVLVFNLFFNKTYYLSCTGSLNKESSSKYGNNPEKVPKTISLVVEERKSFSSTFVSFSNEYGYFSTLSNRDKISFIVGPNAITAIRHGDSTRFTSSTFMSLDRVSKTYISRDKTINFSKDGSVDYIFETSFEGQCIETKPI